MNFFDFFTNYQPGHRIENAIKYDLLVGSTFEKIVDFSLYNVTLLGHAVLDNRLLDVYSRKH